MDVRKLTEADRKYYNPVPQVMQYLHDTVIPKTGDVLDIGPGNFPLSRANVFVDIAPRAVPPGSKLVRLNAAEEPLPFEDKSFEFVYCRHMLEDMYNPFPLLWEMSRVAKAGYIETPSPIAELGRGVDGGSNVYRGYRHHHFIIWAYHGSLRFITKYPIVEYIRGAEMDDECLALLRQGPAYWNTYYLWKDQITFQNRQNVQNYCVDRDYAMMLADACRQSRHDTDEFWLKIPSMCEVPNLQRAFG